MTCLVKFKFRCFAGSETAVYVASEPLTSVHMTSRALRRNTVPDARVLRLAARLLRNELDYHGWQELVDLYSDLLAGLTERDIRTFIDEAERA
jgi:hypothetical protein